MMSDEKKPLKVVDWHKFNQDFISYLNNSDPNRSYVDRFTDFWAEQNIALPEESDYIVKFNPNGTIFGVIGMPKIVLGESHPVEFIEESEDG